MAKVQPLQTIVTFHRQLRNSQDYPILRPPLLGYAFGLPTAFTDLSRFPAPHWKIHLAARCRILLSERVLIMVLDRTVDHATAGTGFLPFAMAETVSSTETCVPRTHLLDLYYYNTRRQLEAQCIIPSSDHREPGLPCVPTFEIRHRPSNLTSVSSRVRPQRRPLSE